MTSGTGGTVTKTQQVGWRRSASSWRPGMHDMTSLIGWGLPRSLSTSSPIKSLQARLLLFVRFNTVDS